MVEMTIELEMLRFNLEQERQRLIEELEQMKASGNSDKDQHNASSFYEKETAADVTTDLERRIALETQKRNSLAGIEHALQKIDAGTYGICDNCGQPIDPARLEALPHAAYCMACSIALKNGVKKK
jgi:RNA polymerase-binding protein DksA